MLFSRMVARRTPKTLEKPRKMVMESTATGIDALTVRPTLSTRYIELAPKSRPRSVPTIKGTGVSSGMSTSAGTNGLWTSSSPSASGARSTVAVPACFDSGASAMCNDMKVRTGNTRRRRESPVAAPVIVESPGVERPARRPSRSAHGRSAPRPRSGAAPRIRGVRPARLDGTSPQGAPEGAARSAQAARMVPSTYGS